MKLSELDATILSKVTDKEIEKEITESAEFTDETGSCLVILEDITCAETEHSPPSGSQGNSPAQAGLSVTNGANNSKVRLQNYIFRHLMVNLRNGHRFGTGLIQQLIRLNIFSNMCASN